MKRAIVLMFILFFPRLLVAHEFDLEELVGEHWYGLYLAGHKAGYAVNSLELDGNRSVIVTEDATFRVSMAGLRQELRIFSKRVYSPAGDLVQINSRVDEVSGANQFVAVVDGNRLIFRSVVGGTTKERVLPMPKESLEDVLQQVRLVGDDPKIGDVVHFSMFEPIYSKEVNGTSRIAGVQEREHEGKTIRLYEVRTTLDILPVETISYVMENGVTFQDIVAGMIEMRLEPKEKAIEAGYDHDVVASNAAMLNAPIRDARVRATLAIGLEPQPDRLWCDTKNLRRFGLLHALVHRIDGLASKCFLRAWGKSSCVRFHVCQDSRINLKILHKLWPD